MNDDSPKLMVVTDQRLIPRLTEYALKVAVRLDLEIIVLFVDEESHWEDTAQHRSKVKKFEAKVKKEAAAFTSLARKYSVKVTAVVDVDRRESAIARIREQDESIRFILSDCNKEDNAAKNRQHPQITVLRPV